MQGQITSTSSRPFGPIGSAPAMEAITRRSHSRSISRRKSWAAPKRVSVAATVSDTMGVTGPNRATVCSRASSALDMVQKDPQKANPTLNSLQFTGSIPP